MYLILTFTCYIIFEIMRHHMKNKIVPFNRCLHEGQRQLLNLLALTMARTWIHTVGTVHLNHEALDLNILYLCLSKQLR